ncbi:MAG TPA: glycosyltransferase family 2 protein [Vicinamibacteria bacterium]
MSGPRVVAVLVNWKRSADTLECLESLLRSDDVRPRAIVCDNDSQDGSLERIAAWAEGREPAAARSPALAHLTSPPHAKPVPFVRLDRGAAEQGGPEGEAPPLTLVATGANLGYAGGNNVALRGLLRRRDWDYVWLLNNDTVVTPGALRALVRRLEERPDAGLCGSTLLHYREDGAVQAYGGASYSRLSGRPVPLQPPCPADRDWVEAHTAYVIGASMMASRRFLETVGLMDESYFLFFEELDWATRAAGRFALAWAPESVVYHKGGASTGLFAGAWNAAAARQLHASQLIYARKHHPHLLPFVWLRHLLLLLQGVFTLRLDRARAIVSAYRGGPAGG